MRLEDFDFDLPEELIALRPARPRPASRLLVATPERLIDSTVAALGDWLRPGDLLVLNDTKVIPARLSGLRRRANGAEARIEATLIAAQPDGAWRALARPGKRLAVGDVIAFGAALTAEVRDKDGAEVVLAFDRAGAGLDAALQAVGEMPLPPYIAARRAPDARDREDYQTVFATRPGAVAAPTASLHFDEALLAALEARGVAQTRVTLHVGAGTFLPVKVENIEAHRMHAEWGEIDAEAAGAIEATLAAGGRVIPVGTTALRLIETAATGPARIASWRGETDIFIRPGHGFRVTRGLMTNFHLPKSTLLMLVSALMGVGRMREVYAHAIAERYRFFSYGDSSLLLPKG
ncbi:MAG: tRNA preQ1(34) S-adenosylmethionine ribosyltransferase-isomerase QueA [Rhodovulum sulfidophilum]|uniref:S-adenosylmethionine:tRNA ribosyltransferase-isomerase n=1 Tax=Rhodovulum sulfidophilum TaxID=35806 RepID=A0A2W5NF32_RHOSU|nr:MAG: tRNA preQ1(34) S-adenosylmethionine ribosyltransferase-isomerase QueA [Rhodovulum sulfidophilum]